MVQIGKAQPNWPSLIGEGGGQSRLKIAPS